MSASADRLARYNTLLGEHYGTLQELWATQHRAIKAEVERDVLAETLRAVMPLVRQAVAFIGDDPAFSKDFRRQLRDAYERWDAAQGSES